MKISNWISTDTHSLFHAAIETALGACSTIIRGNDYFEQVFHKIALLGNHNDLIITVGQKLDEAICSLVWNELDWGNVEILCD